MTTPRIVAGRYEVLREIARGGMAIVYEAIHVVSRRRVALKVLFTASFADDMSRARFLREVSAPARIGHRGIVEVFDAGFDDGDGAPFVAMELLEGHTLRREFDRGPRALERTLTLFQGILAPMAAAHAVSIVHRDLKPENVFVTQSNGVELVKVLDFGLARTVDERAEKETRTGVAMGTPHYMAPEQAVSARDVTPAADVWALGVMLYEAISGRTPFTGPTPSAIVVEAVTQPHVPLNHLLPQTPPALVALVDGCLQKEPTRRPPNAAALLAEVAQLQASPGASGQPSLAQPALARSVPP
ncbi:MAG: serine/threonine protein kinase, partial [Deltaproteobacteria bacterium]|nr:serine/threonine protein kinase [Deltaproteobacteria bacterium]